MGVTVPFRAGLLALWLFGQAAIATGQANVENLQVRTIAEVEVRLAHEGRQTKKLVRADRLLPGDEVVFTLEIRNTGLASVRSPTITRPVPAHMHYVADSATGPGADISFSVDGGTTFDRPENLRVTDPDGNSRNAKAQEYTHIRWSLRRNLKSKSVAFARFRAVVE